MIHDAIVPVTCDGSRCHNGLDIKIISGESTTGDIQFEILKSNWIITGKGKHYCSQECASEAEDEHVG